MRVRYTTWRGDLREYHFDDVLWGEIREGDGGPSPGAVEELQRGLERLARMTARLVEVLVECGMSVEEVGRILGDESDYRGLEILPPEEDDT